MSKLYKNKVKSNYGINSLYCNNHTQYINFIKNTKNNYFFKFDISKYYLNIDHNILKQELINNYKIYIKKDLSKRYQKFLDNILDDFLQKSIFKGKSLPIGNSLGHILAELYILRLDFNLVKNKVEYIRYVDDIVVFAKNQNELKKIISQIISPILEDLKLQINFSKTISGRINKDKLNFLGFDYIGGHFSITQEKVNIFKSKIINITDLRKNITQKHLIKKINNLVYGFGHYYKISSCNNIFENLDQFIRARTRRSLTRIKSKQLNKINNLIYTNIRLNEIGLKSLFNIKKDFDKKTIKKLKKSSITTKQVDQITKNNISLKSENYSNYLLFQEIQQLKQELKEIKNLLTKSSKDKSL